MFNVLRKCKVLGDILLVCLAIAPTIYLEVYGVPAKGEFSCTDTSIHHAYTGETYPFWSLLVIALPVPIVLILLIETVTKQSRYKTLVTFIFGLFTSVSLVEVLKYTVGRPRPVFIEWCQPSLWRSQSACTNSTNQSEFLTGYSCENAKIPGLVFKAIQSTLSFPSGHASMSVYTMTYLAFYFHFRLSSKRSLLFKHLLQAVCITLAASVSVSRISDHMHFISDVLAGVCIGVLFAVWIVFFVSDLSRKDGKGNLKEEVSLEV